MRSPEAIAAALGMLSYPRMASRARHIPLPRGITFLLEVAAADPDAMADAAAITGQTEATLRKAAGFFIEQVMLDERSDFYRLLGTSSSASSEELRRHMALIMRWLHPDLITDHERDGGLNRSLYATRVLAAWEALKTDARRAAYDAKREKEGLRKATTQGSEREAGRTNAPEMAYIALGRSCPRPPSQRPLGLSRLLILFGFRT